MPIQFTPISQQQYAAARLASAITGGGRSYQIMVGSALRDRTPVPQPEPLADGQFVWGKPSNFSWSTQNTNETGPHVNTTFKVNWPDYGLAPDPDPEKDPNYDESEEEQLPPILYEWKEVARVETTVRITGTNGAYVDFNRIDEAIFALPASDDGRSQFARLKFMKM